VADVSSSYALTLPVGTPVTLDWDPSGTRLLSLPQSGEPLQSVVPDEEDVVEELTEEILTPPVQER
jgi:hypothetical protein